LDLQNQLIEIQCTEQPNSFLNGGLNGILGGLGGLSIGAGNWGALILGFYGIISGIF
jgi:hypothetical protein